MTKQLWNRPASTSILGGSCAAVLSLIALVAAAQTPAGAPPQEFSNLPNTQLPSTPTDKAQTFYLFVLNDAAPGKEEEFNRWYDQQHAQDVLINPDYVNSQRYVAAEQQLVPGAQPPTKYLIEFKIVTKDIGTRLQHIHDNLRSGKTVMTNNGIGRGANAGGDLVYRAITDVMPAKGVKLNASGREPHAKYLLLEFSSATPGKERQFNDWYDKERATKIASLPGLKQWQRFEFNPVQLNAMRRLSIAEQYMTMYEIEPRSDTDLRRLQEGLRKLATQGVDCSGKIGAALTYRAHGPTLWGDEVKKKRGL